MNSKKIRLALINIQSGIGTTRGYWQYALDIRKYFMPHGPKHINRLTRVCREMDIDILATAEIDRGSSRTKNIDQLKLIADNTKLKYYRFFSTLKVDNIIRQGNAIHSAFPVLYSDRFVLSGSGEPRVVGRTTIKINNKLINFFVTHLSLEFPSREKQINELSEIINASEHPVVLAGDFNVKHKDELELLEKSKLQKVFSGKTFPSWNPQKRLDYIFASSSIRVSEGVVLKERVSDHSILMLDLAI